MLNYGDQTPSRFELLSMVKKHSKLLEKNSVDQDDASDLEMDSRFWHDIMDLYFVRGRESRGRQEDDMMFFVRKMGVQRSGANDDEDGNSPFFVRRWAPKLDELLGESSLVVDWRRSFYLNLIAHTSFTVTVAICSHQVLRNYQSGQGKPLSPIYKVVKTVYASPSRINFHLDSRKEAETSAAYPEICFAVDDFDSTFDAVVLTDVDHCYCVILDASDGAAFPSESSPRDRSSGDTRVGKTKSSKITLFSGFVSYQMVRDAYDAGRTGFGSLLSLAHSPGKADRLYMKGPGGRGEVEVAVSGVVDQSKEELDHHSRGSALGKIVRRAASVASVAAKHAYAAASSTRTSYEDMIPLRCCLMSVSLPWEHIAHDLLFKGSPPVNL
ncbi:OLC1v1017034C4 [Oldenlandia corymbosa var. corymbosa]|uniref:OLC1v1017034C4 n=2 Tax=Oldenlandia corymbosa var. corymbosa TaxID=529605 RepID=A0AAV1E8H9_OLDCO|nr:OLC1v1017034C4 [Oldenlandia corymbosa var. corymbosa]